MKKIFKQKISSVAKTVWLLLPSGRHWLMFGIIFIAIAISGFLLSADATFAGVAGFVVEHVVKAIAWLALLAAQFFMAMAIFLLHFFIQLAGYNNFIDTPVVKLGWVMVRDLANMFFVVALLVIAFATMLGRESYEWKKTMVKLVLMAIFVNFSLLIGQLIIDVAHVFTVTFLNAIASTASGNLIQMFQFDKVWAANTPGEGETGPVLFQILLASGFAAMLSGLAMVTIGAYTIVMLARTVVLWVALILSPLGFIFSILPATQKYAKEWWDTFSKHVLAAPIMVFFLWLAFATMGAGNVAGDLARDNPYADRGEGPDSISGRGPAVTDLNLASQWANLSSFLVAIAFLLYGVEKTQELGVKGSGALSSVAQFGKNVATIATGYAAGRWLVGKGKEAGMGALKHAPFIGGKAWQERGELIKQYARARYGQGMRAVSRVPVLGYFARGGIRRRKRAEQWKNAADFIEKTRFKEQSSKEAGNVKRRYEGIYQAYEDRSRERDAAGVLESKAATLRGVRWKDGKPAIDKDMTDEVLDRMGITDPEERKRLQQATLGREVARYTIAKKTAEDSAKEAVEKERGEVLKIGEAEIKVKLQPLQDKIKDIDGKIREADLEIKKNTDSTKRGGLIRVKTEQEELRVSTIEEMRAVEEGYSTRGAKMAYQALATAAIEAEAKKAEEDMRNRALGGVAARDLFDRVQAADIGADAAKKFIEGIKQKQIGDIFTKGADELKENLKRMTFSEVIEADLSPGARLALSQILEDYTKDIAGVEKTAATDQAETAFTKERYDVETPATAYRAWVKKRLEGFEGMEREQAVRRAMGSFTYLMLRQKRGEVLGKDQQAEMMASQEYLTKQAWSDDGLARIGSLLRTNREKLKLPSGNVSALTGEELEKAQMMEDVFVNQLEWGKVGGDEKLEMVNKSSGERANDMQRLAAYGGDVGLVQAENAVLRNKRDKNVGYKEAAEQLAADVVTDREIGIAAEKGDVTTLTTKAIKLGLVANDASERMKSLAAKELQAFYLNFVKGLSDAGEISKKYLSEIESHAEANQRLASFKNFAASTAHLDDGGHTYFNMDLGFAHGQLYDDAAAFMESEWKKRDASERYSKLKIHGVAQMDEVTGTASHFRPEAMAITFGVVTQRMLEKLDERNRRLLVKLSGDDADLEQAKTTDGRFSIGKKDSDLVVKTFGNNEEGALKDVARDFAVALKKTPEFFATLIGGHSGVNFNDSIGGKFNFVIGEGTAHKEEINGTPVNAVKKLQAWINRMIGDESVFRDDNNKIVQFRDEDRAYEDVVISDADVNAILLKFEGNRKSAQQQQPPAGGGGQGGGPAAGGGSAAPPAPAVQGGQGGAPPQAGTPPTTPSAPPPSPVAPSVGPAPAAAHGPAPPPAAPVAPPAPIAPPDPTGGPPGPAGPQGSVGPTGPAAPSSSSPPPPPTAPPTHRTLEIIQRAIRETKKEIREYTERVDRNLAQINSRSAAQAFKDGARESLDFNKIFLSKFEKELADLQEELKKSESK